MEEIDDITLLKARKGNAQAFRALYAHYSPFVWRLCYRSSNGDKRRAEEIMQDAFIKAHRYLGTFSGGSTFSTWLYRIAYNCVNEHFSNITRIGSRETALNEDEASGADPPALPYENREIVKRILEPLSEQDRFLLTAREVEGVSYEELAGIMGVKEGTLRARLMRLKADIRERLERAGVKG